METRYGDNWKAVTCENPYYTCRDNQTCCKMPGDEGYGCCPMPKAVCCPDGKL